MADLNSKNTEFIHRNSNEALEITALMTGF